MEKLGKYEIRRELGRGAMGVVYEAWDPMIKRAVAIKTIRADQLAREEAAEVVARFRREAQAAGRLNHPNVVAIYDFDEDAGTSFIAMEYVAGRDLREMFAANERFAVADAVRLMEQVLAALDYSHRQGVVHRDIKPANVFVLPDGTVKVADFGIAHVDTSSLTHAGSVMGTPGYMSPEQILGLPVDGRSDIFSAGVILYQFLTGERPFAASAAATTMQKVLHEEPLPPSTLNVQLPPAIDAVVKKALAKKPEDRYPTAAAFADDLRGAIGPRTGAMPVPIGVSTNPEATVLGTATAGAASSSPTIVRPAPSTARPEMQPSATPAAAQPPAYRKPSQSAAIAVVAAFIVAAVAAVAWMAMQREAKPARDGVATAEPALPQPTTGVTAAAAGAESVPTPPAPAVSSAPGIPVPAVATEAPPAAMPKTPPGTLVITATGLADPSDPRYAGDAARAGQDARADARQQLVAKALALLVERESLARNYAVLNDRLIAKSASYVGNVVRESEPRAGKDGLVSLTTEAVVDVKAVQKSLNEMSQSERIELIRASGDPRIALRVSVRDAERTDMPPRDAPVVENLLKARIKSFGFRTWSDGAEAAPADFVLTADASVRRISTRLQASGITITKHAVAAMSVKCVDRATGEEIYFSTALPKGTGSYATEEEALKHLGERIADAFSRDFFLQHVTASGRRVSLTIEGLPDASSADLVARELAGLPFVISVAQRGAGARRTWDLELAGSGSPGDLVQSAVLSPLNAKLGEACFALGATGGENVTATLDERCRDGGLVSRLETHPPAQLYGAPPARRSAVVKNPDLRRKLDI